MNQKLLVAERLTKLREEAGETQSDIAKLLNYKFHQQVSYLENGQRQLNINQIVILAKHFNVSTDYLLGVTDAQTNDRDMQFVCDYTGQSKETIEFLVSIKKMGGCNLIDLFKNELVVNWVNQNLKSEE